MTDLTSHATKIGRDATNRARAATENNPFAQKTKDAVYTAVGLGVLTTQRATVAFKKAQSPGDAKDVSASVKKTVNDVASTLKRQSAWLDDQLNKTAKSIDEVMSPIEQHFPATMRDVAAKARTFAEKLSGRTTSSEPSTPAAKKRSPKSPKPKGE
jgi:hypothetical protein